MSEDYYSRFSGLVGMLKIYFELVPEDQKLLYPITSPDFQEAVDLVSLIQRSSKLGYREIAQKLDRSVSHVQKIINCLRAEGFPILATEDYSEAPSTGRKRYLLEMRQEEREELKKIRSREWVYMELDSELEPWVEFESQRVGLSKSEFVCSALRAFRARQSNESMSRLKEKYSKEATKPLLLF